MEAVNDKDHIKIECAIEFPESPDIFDEKVPPSEVLVNGSKSESDKENRLPVAPCTIVSNVTEKILICLDISKDMASKTLNLSDGSSVSAFELAKKVIRLFIHNKHMINAKHEFALVILIDNATKVSEFSSDPTVIEKELKDITETIPCTSFDINSLFDLIKNEKIPDNNQCPSYVIRTIFIYGRSNIVPNFNDKNPLQIELIESKYFFFDVLFIHNNASEENKCEEIFKYFLEFDTRCTNYVLDVVSNVTRMHSCMAKLLGHPLQRVPQQESDFKLHSDLD